MTQHPNPNIDLKNKTITGYVSKGRMTLHWNRECHAIRKLLLDSLTLVTLSDIRLFSGGYYLAQDPSVTHYRPIWLCYFCTQEIWRSQLALLEIKHAPTS